jgi:hypothetical protein
LTPHFFTRYAYRGRMKHYIPHGLDLPLAKKATQKAFETYKAKFADYNPTEKWVSDTRAEIGFQAKGIKLSGSIELEPKRIGLELEVPFLLKMFQGKAIAIIEEEIKEWVEKARKGELD